MTDERNKAKAAILERRARLMAMALAASGVGVACGGKAEGENSGGDGDGDGYIVGQCLTACLGACLDYPCLQQPCLTQVCLSYDCEVEDDCYPPGAGGAVVCLSQEYLGGMGGMGGADTDEDPDPAGTGGEPRVCLTPPR